MLTIIDTVRDGQLHKLMLARDNENFEILGAAANRQPQVLAHHMTEQAALVIWRKMVAASYNRTTHNAKEADDLAQKRILEIVRTIH